MKEIARIICTELKKKMNKDCLFIYEGRDDYDKVFISHGVPKPPGPVSVIQFYDDDILIIDAIHDIQTKKYADPTFSIEWVTNVLKHGLDKVMNER